MASNKKTLIKGAKKVIVGDGSISENVDLLIEGGIIKKVGPLLQSEDGTIVINAKEKYIMPGIIDTHVHMDTGGEADPDSIIGCSDEFLAIRAAFLVRKMLERGVTTVGDACCGGNISFGVKEAYTRGILPGPRILCSGAMLTITGGRSPVVRARELDGPFEARKAAREQIKKGADFIKVASTAAVSSAGMNVKSVQLLLDEMASIVEVAHNAGRKVHSHAYGYMGIQNSLDAGVDVLVHGISLTDQQIESMLENETILTPTLVTYRQVQEKKDFPEEGLPDFYKERSKEISLEIEENFRRAQVAGITMALGSDSGMSYVYYGEATINELKLLAEMGLGNHGAILAATGHAALALSLEDQLGCIKEGMAADLLILERDPLENISYLDDPTIIERVFIEGKQVAEKGRLLPIRSCNLVL